MPYETDIDETGIKSALPLDEEYSEVTEEVLDPALVMLPGEDLEDEDEDDGDDPIEERLQSLVTRAAEEAILWREEELEDQQSKATDYYHGRPFGNEAVGRSRVVSTDVRDTINGMLPSLCRIFFGPEDTVEYEPRGPEDEKAARQLTEMANYVVRNDNDGFLQIYGAFKDAMIRKIGVIKVWWEDSERREGYEYSGLGDQELLALQQEEGVNLEVVASYPVAAPGTPTGMITAYDARVERTHDDGKVRFAVIPPEEFIFSPKARDRDSAEMMGHVRAVPAAELISMGVDPDLVEEHKGNVRHSSSSTDDMQSKRRFDLDHRQELADETDDSREMCWYGEIYVYADTTTEDGTGTADLVKVEVIGDNHEIVDWYVCDERPFAIFGCDPEPHTLIGPCVADKVMDIQLIKSAILRGQMDSLTLSLNPRTEVVTTEVNMADVMNHEVGGVIRVEKPGMVREVGHDFSKSGAAAFPMLQYQDEQKENRTGQSKASMGLDADALQSSTKAAVAATLSGAQQQIEMLARIFAETGMRQLYKLILKTLVQHQDKARTVRIRNEWVDMDPAAWHADMDVSINLALGAGGSEEKIALLGMITEHQKQLLDEGSPLASRVKYRNGLARAVELAGFPNASEFYPEWTEEQEQDYAAKKAEAPPSDPAMLAVENEFKIQQAKLELEALKIQLEHDRKVAEMQLDFSIKQATAEAQYGAQIDNQEMMADMQMAKAVIDAEQKNNAAKAAGGPTNGNAAQQGVSGQPGPGGQ